MPRAPFAQSSLTDRVVQAACNASLTITDLCRLIPKSILRTHVLELVWTGKREQIPVVAARRLAKTLQVPYEFLRNGNNPPEWFVEWQKAEQEKQRRTADEVERQRTDKGGPNARAWRLRRMIERKYPNTAMLPGKPQILLVAELAEALLPKQPGLRSAMAQAIDDILEASPRVDRYRGKIIADHFHVSPRWFLDGEGQKPAWYQEEVRAAVKTMHDCKQVDNGCAAAPTPKSTHIPNRLTFTLLVELTWRADLNDTTLPNGQSWKDAIAWLLRNGLIHLQAGDLATGITLHYTATEKGCFFIDHLMTIPLPVQSTTFKIPN